MPEPPSDDEQQRRTKRLRRLEMEHNASVPNNQYLTQLKEEQMRAWKADPRTNFLDIMPIGFYHDDALKLIRDRWVEQGIWRDEWGNGRHYFTLLGPANRWKHEEPLEVESDNADTEEGSTVFLPKKRRPKTDDEKRRTAERRVTREREREASRPFHQFVYQISKERERILDESTSGETASTATAASDINTQAYESVKSIWRKRGIWNSKWGILPGMSWKHEEPLDEEADDEPAATQVNLFGNRTHEDRPPQSIAGSLFQDADKPAATQVNLFGNRIHKDKPPQCIFGSPSPDEEADDEPAAVQVNLFGNRTHKDKSPQCIFGSPSLKEVDQRPANPWLSKSFRSRSEYEEVMRLARQFEEAMRLVGPCRQPSDFQQVDPDDTPIFSSSAHP